jgi:hypothetical protein
MQNPLNDIGTNKIFNGIDILQARDFVKISCKTCIGKIVRQDCDAPRMAKRSRRLQPASANANAS